MNHSEQPQQMSPEDQALFQSAGKEESDAMTDAMAAWLQNRVVQLRAEVLKRDQRIAELEAELAAEHAKVQPEPEEDFPSPPTVDDLDPARA